MISHFPDFFPDETVYSVASRYMDRMQFRLHSIVSQNLFGGPYRCPLTDFPSNIEYLVQALSPNHKYTADMIIDHHTLFPLVAPFFPPERAIMLRQSMKTSERFNRHSIAGISSSKILQSRWLKYCPVCVDCDRLIYGECYWHRVHQVPGVLVCPTHEVMLEESTASVLYGDYIAKYRSAEKSVVSVTPRSIPADLRLSLIQLAKNAKCLLEYSNSLTELPIKDLYFQHLINHGFVTATGQVRYLKLKAAISEYYPPGLLETLGCTISQSKEIWFRTWSRIRHPLRHLLFIQFLCGTVQQFFSRVQYVAPPFGNGPWPCLNPLCSDYKAHVITSCSLQQGKFSLPIGRFSCHCGFTYSRTGPDKNENAIFRGKIIKYGHMWDQTLTTYWLDQNISRSQIAHLMCTSSIVIRHQAARLNLPFAPDLPRRGKRPMIYQDRIDEQRATYRHIWEEALKHHPQANLTKIINITHSTYHWLKSHDKGWLKEHYPVLTPSASNYERLVVRTAQIRNERYLQADAGLAQMIKQTARSICASPDFPIKVTRGLLATQIGDPVLRKRHNVLCSILPLTSQAFVEAAETNLAFIWRKLRWAVQSCLTEQLQPSYYTFSIYAHIESIALRHPIYKRLIQTAYNSLLAGILLDEQMPENISELEKIAPKHRDDFRRFSPGSLAFELMNAQETLKKMLSRQREQTYELVSILLLVVAAVVNGAETYSAIARWSYRNEKWLLRFGFPENHFPNPSTIKNRCATVKAERFESMINTWLDDNFPGMQTDDVKTQKYVGNIHILGMQLLQAYRHIASAIVVKLT